MVNIVPVARKLTPADIKPNFDYQIQGLPVNEEEASKQKEYLQMFIQENFEIVESQTSGMAPEQIDSYLKGAKDTIALVNLWIDSLNTAELPTQDITE